MTHRIQILFKISINNIFRKIAQCHKVCKDSLAVLRRPSVLQISFQNMIWTNPIVSVDHIWIFKMHFIFTKWYTFFKFLRQFKDLVIYATFSNSALPTRRAYHNFFLHKELKIDVSSISIHIVHKIEHALIINYFTYKFQKRYSKHK